MRGSQAMIDGFDKRCFLRLSCLRSTRWICEQKLASRVLVGLGCAVWLIALIQWPEQAIGQQVGVNVPYTTTSSSWHEHFGTQLGFQFPSGGGPGSRVVGWNGVQTLPFLSFQQGGVNSAIPPFGGYDPNSAARFGFGSFGRNGGGFSLGLTMSQGSTRTMTNTTSSLVVPNGQGGGIWSGQVSPFVVGVVPVNGGMTLTPPLDNAVTRAVQSGQLDLTELGRGDRSASAAVAASTQSVSFGNADSTAGQAVSSVASIKQRKAREKQLQREQLLGILDRASEYIDQERFDLARTQLRRAERLAVTPEDHSLIDQLYSRFPERIP